MTNDVLKPKALTPSPSPRGRGVINRETTLSLWERVQGFCLSGEGNNKRFLLFLILLFGACNLSFSAQALDDPEQKLTDLIKTYVVAKNPGYKKDEVKVNFKMAENIFNNLRKLDKKTQFKILEGYPEIKGVGAAIFPIQIKTGEETTKVLIRAKVEILRGVVVAAKKIKQGKMIGSEDLKIENRDVALLPQKYFVNTNSIIGKEAKLSIPAGSTVFNWMAGEQPLIRRGAELNIIAIAPGIKVKSRGVAIEDGYLDSLIKVSRKDSKKIITAKVKTAGDVEVIIE
ncbi:MAG: flagellar basal body P-ring formation chaperone FlgA [bacterium]